MLTADGAARLLAVLGEARARGFLGPGPPERHLEHSIELAACVDSVPDHFLDLGSGGGVPGLVWAAAWDDSRATLLEAHRRRCQWLRGALIRLGLDQRCVVAEGRAELLARDPTLRERFDLVVARAFGPPATTAECAAGFVAVGGVLVVSEAPRLEPGRWPVEGLARLGFGGAQWCRRRSATAVILEKVEGAAERWPRRVGVPGKRPLW